MSHRSSVFLSFLGLIPLFFIISIIRIIPGPSVYDLFEGYDHFLFHSSFTVFLSLASSPAFSWFLSVAAPETSVKSVTTTLASPSFFTHLLTDLITRFSLRSRACKWSSVKMGLSGSWAKDSLITSLRRYSGSINSCSLSNVERLILKENGYHNNNH